jgi:hypothetical protein
MKPEKSRIPKVILMVLVGLGVVAGVAWGAIAVKQDFDIQQQYSKASADFRAMSLGARTVFVQAPSYRDVTFARLVELGVVPQEWIGGQNQWGGVVEVGVAEGIPGSSGNPDRFYIKITNIPAALCEKFLRDVHGGYVITTRTNGMWDDFNTVQRNSKSYCLANPTDVAIAF